MFAIFGQINPPPAIAKWNPAGCSPYGSTVACGLLPFINGLIKLAIVVAGLYAFLNLIFAGYGFITAGGDSKATEQAVGKIWQSLIGLLLVAGSFVLAAIFGYLIFGDASAILYPKITTP
jgi:hypothetical protein